MSRAEAREFATRLFLREHDRWTQNALVLFGALVSIFALHGQLKPAFSLCFALFLAIIVSFVAVVVVLCIRASTDSWRYTINRIDNQSTPEPISPFDLFQEHMDQFSYWRDLLATWFICKPDGELTDRPWWQKSFLSVTRMYTRLASSALVIFVILYFVNLCHPLEK